MAITVIRYSERPELWEDTDAVSQAVWPEYNHHGEVLGRYWGRLFEDFPEFQFVLYDDHDGVLAESHTVPCVWDGTTDGLGEGIDAMIAGAFDGARGRAQTDRVGGAGRGDQTGVSGPPAGRPGARRDVRIGA